VNIFKERRMYSNSKIMNILFDLLVAYLPFVGFASLVLNIMIKLVNFEES
jgi:hypothetical protein